MATLEEKLTDTQKALLSDLFQVTVGDTPEGLLEEDKPFRYVYKAMRTLLTTHFEIPVGLKEPLLKYHQSIFLEGFCDYELGVTDEDPSYCINVTVCKMPTLHVPIEMFTDVVQMMNESGSGRYILSRLGLLPSPDVHLFDAPSAVRFTTNELKEFEDFLNLEFASRLVIPVENQVVFLLRKPRFRVTPKIWGVFARSIVYT